MDGSIRHVGATLAAQWAVDFPGWLWLELAGGYSLELAATINHPTMYNRIAGASSSTFQSLVTDTVIKPREQSFVVGNFILRRRDKSQTGGVDPVTDWRWVYCSIAVTF